MALASNDGKTRRRKPADDELRTLLAAFIQTNAKPGAPDDQRAQQLAFDDVHHALERNPEVGWRLVELACHAKLTEREMAFVAAPLLEDLLACHGDIIFERLEQSARRDDRMLPMLAMVWQGFAPLSASR
jgi:hypothetical protein